MTKLHREIERRLNALFQRLADGGDAPPSMHLRLEGLLEAAVLLGDARPEDLQELMDSAYRAISGESLAARYGDDWQVRYPFPQIPAYMQRAPVTPSTAD